jgi:electron transfer flavoprotein alpha/beta subunit
MAAKKKPIDTKKPSDLGKTLAPPTTEYMDFQKPPSKQAGKKFEGVESVKEVVRLLRDEAKVL